MTKLISSTAALTLFGATVLFGSVASAAPASPLPVVSSSDGLVVNAQMMKKKMKKKKMMKKSRMM